MRAVRRRRPFVAGVVLVMAAGPFAAGLLAQTPPVNPDGTAGAWSFEFVQAAVDDLVASPLPAAYGGVTIRQYFFELGRRLWGSIAVIMCVIQGLKVSMGKQIDLWGLVTFLLWVSFPMMVLEGFYTPYLLFGNQTFIQMVVGQGQELAAAFNGPGGAFSQLNARVYSLLGEVFRQLGISFVNMTSFGGIVREFVTVVGTLIALNAAGAVVIVTIVILLIATLLVYTQVVWATVAVGMLTLLGPVFVPFLLVEQLSFLFWSWFKGLIQYSFQIVVAGLMLRLISALAGYPLDGLSDFIASIGSFSPEGDTNVFMHAFEVVRRLGTWVPVVLAAFLLSFKVGEITQVMIGGSQNLSSGLTAVAAGAAATMATGGAAMAGGLAKAGLGAASRGAAARGMKGTAAVLSRGADVAGWVASSARGGGAKGGRREEE